MVTPYKPTERQKSEALGSLFYEIQQLFFSTHLVGEAQPVMNAFLESMLVHVRVLLDFFERTERSTYFSRDGRVENDDVLGTDFGFAARAVELEAQYRARLNKDLVHLAYSRSTRTLPDEKKWPRKDVVRPLVDRVVEFIDFVGEAELSKSSGATLDNWKELRYELVKMKARFAGVITDI